jgi:hypothetical protein
MTLMYVLCFINVLCCVLCSGDVVGTVNLEAVVAGHKRRRAENALNIMTVVLAKVTHTDRERHKGETGLTQTGHREWDAI